NASRIHSRLSATKMISPSLDEFTRLAEHANLIPVVAEIIGDVETPVSAFQKIGRGGLSFLFESAERNEESGRFSFIGIDPLIVFDHRFRLMRIIVAADVLRQSAEDAYDAAVQKIDSVLEKLALPSRLQPIGVLAAGGTHPTAGHATATAVSTPSKSNTNDFE